MQIIIDTEAGTVTMPVAVYLKLAGQALSADAALDRLFEGVKAGRRLPEVCTYYVSGYTQVYGVDQGGRAYWVCSCNDFRYRRQSAAGEGAWMNRYCKHIVAAGWDHAARTTWR